MYVLASPRWSRWLASKTTARTRLPTRKADNDCVERNVSLFYPHIFIQSKTCLTSEDKGNCGLFSSLPYGWVQVSLLHACCQLWSHGVPGGNRSVPHDHSGATWAVAGNQRSCRIKTPGGTALSLQCRLGTSSNLQRSTINIYATALPLSPPDARFYAILWRCWRDV